MARIFSATVTIALGAAALLTAAAASASPTLDTFNTTVCPIASCPTNLNPTSPGNTLTFTSGGFSIKAEAFNSTGGTTLGHQPTGGLTSDMLGLYSGSGLGVGNQTTPDNALDDSPRLVNGQEVNHTDFVIFQLPANSTAISISLNSFGKTFANAATVFVGGGSAYTSLSSFVGVTLATLEAVNSGFKEFSFGNTNVGAGQGGTFVDTISSTGVSGKFLIVAAALTAPTSNCGSAGASGCNYFKVAAITLDPTSVPEPSSLAVLLAGIGIYGVRRYRGKLLRKAA